MALGQTIHHFYRYLPEAMRVEIDVRRRAHLWRQQGCIFVHVPKAAGTSVSCAIYGRTLGHFRAVDTRRICPDLWAGSFTFGLVRDPLERLVSAYRFASAGGGEMMKMHAPHRYSGAAFETFDSFLKDWLAKQDLGRVDPVFRPQSSYLLDSAGRQVVDRIFHIADIDAAMRAAEVAVGRKLSVIHQNRTPGGRGDVVVENGLEELVRQIYRSDYDLLAIIPRERH